MFEQFGDNLIVDLQCTFVALEHDATLLDLVEPLFEFVPRVADLVFVEPVEQRVGFESVHELHLVRYFFGPARDLLGFEVDHLLRPALDEFAHLELLVLADFLVLQPPHLVLELLELRAAGVECDDDQVLPVDERGYFAADVRSLRICRGCYLP